MLIYYLIIYKECQQREAKAQGIILWIILKVLRDEWLPWHPTLQDHIHTADAKILKFHG